MTKEPDDPRKPPLPAGSPRNPTASGGGTSGRSATLTDRELKVVALVLEGLTNPEIGHRLGISKRTVSSHLSAIFRKLRVRSRIDLILQAPELKGQAEKLQRPLGAEGDLKSD